VHREVGGRGRPHGPRTSLRLLQVASFTSSFDRFLIAPLLLVIALDLDESIAAVTLAATVYYQAYGVMQAAWAVVSDRLGRVRTIRLALALAAVSGLAAAAAPGIGALVAARGVAGACFAAAVPGALMYVGDTVPLRERQAPLTELMTGSALGLALATAGAGLLGDHLHWRVAFAVPASVAAVLVVRLRRVPEPKAPPPMPVGRSFVAVLSSPWALAVLALSFCEGLILVGLLTFLPVTLQTDGYTASVAGLITGAYGVAVLGNAWLVRRVAHRAPAALLVGVGATAGCVAFAALLVDDGPVGVLVAASGLGAAWAFMHSTLQTWVTDVVPQARATAVSLFASLLFTGGATASALGGGFVEAGRFDELVGWGLAVMAVVGVLGVVARAGYARGGGAAAE
jgi:predicted MFS family arabinose efflux permease